MNFKLPQSVPATHNITQLYDDIENNLAWSQDAIYDLDADAVADLQQYWLRRRFNDLRPRIKALDKLAQDLDINEIDTIDDVVPLCFPHTMMKAYAVSDLNKRRFDRMNRWLGTLSIYDLSSVDVGGLETLDNWLDRLHAATPLDPQLSSGTSGKVSVQPKTVVEGRHLMDGILRCFMPYRDEPGFDPRTGEATFISPWPVRSGPHHVTMMHTNMVKHTFGGDESRVITIGQHKMAADELWLSGRLRRAESIGEQLQLTESERALAQQMAEKSKKTSSPEQMDLFIEQAMTRQKGKKVFITSSWQRYYELAQACKLRGVKPDYAPGSMMGVGGGAKNWVFPEGWRKLIDEIFPLPLIELYSMSEFSAVSRLCPNGYWHVPSWGVIWVLDPGTSKPYPRSGVQSGRLACFDLLARSYWAGTLSGDKVTVHWDGGCSCGRKGPYIEKDIRRFTEAEGGDDKISCSKMPDAYSDLVKFTLGDINE
jgi:hypothetical protein